MPVPGTLLPLVPSDHCQTSPVSVSMIRTVAPVSPCLVTGIARYLPGSAAAAFDSVTQTRVRVSASNRHMVRLPDQNGFSNSCSDLITSSNALSRLFRDVPSALEG